MATLPNREAEGEAEDGLGEFEAALFGSGEGSAGIDGGMCALFLGDFLGDFFQTGFFSLAGASSSDSDHESNLGFGLKNEKTV